MKAEEIRIGNLIKSGRTGNIHPAGINTIIKLLNIPDFCEPIPLTEEWFDKFKFTEYNDLNGSSGDRVKYYGEKDGEGRIKYFQVWIISDEETMEFQGIYFEHHIKLKYVHQLQNLYFALTGEELTCKQ